MENENNDLLSMKPITNAIGLASSNAVQGTSKFLGYICLPAAEELGLYLKDKVQGWRQENAIKTLEKARELLNHKKLSLPINVHPKIACNIVEHSSWSNDELLQNLWAGLLVSSCTSTENSDSNAIYIDILSKLTYSQAKLIEYICPLAQPKKTPGGWVIAEELEIDPDDLIKISGIPDRHQLDAELDFLSSIDLIQGGFYPESYLAKIIVRPLCLQLYARCQGYAGSIDDYYNCK